jgi:rubrerythrin
MELGTFGAIIRSALELEKQASDFYLEAGHDSLRPVFADLSKQARKRLTRLANLRREGINEMILEPITGFDDNAFRVDVAAEAEEAGMVELAIALEENLARFYTVASAKTPLNEVSRAFRQMAKENETHLSKLANLQSHVAN